MTLQNRIIYICIWNVNPRINVAVLLLKRLEINRIFDLFTLIDGKVTSVAEVVPFSMPDAYEPAMLSRLFRSLFSFKFLTTMYASVPIIAATSKIIKAIRNLFLFCSYQKLPIGYIVSFCVSMSINHYLLVKFYYNLQTTASAIQNLIFKHLMNKKRLPYEKSLDFS